MQEVVIKTGSYRNKEIAGLKCELIAPIKYGAKGWFGNFKVPGQGTKRIQLPDENSLEYIGKPSISKEEEETENQIIQRIKERFEIFHYSVEGIAQNHLRSLMVAGASGIGKSESIQRILEQQREVSGIEFEVVRGNIVSSFQLYQTLYMNSYEENILVLDDCDNILRDPNGLNILKAALESGDRPRIISYKSQSVTNLGLPSEFEYKGRMIFITNENFQKIIDKDSSVLSKHLSALIDRGLYLDLRLHNRREIYCRIKQMVEENNLLDHTDIQESYYPEILAWIKDNLDKLRSLSLRTPIHIAEMIRTNEDNWRRMAGVFLLRQGR